MNLWRRTAATIRRLWKLGENPTRVVDAESLQTDDNEFSDSVCDVGYILRKFNVSEYEPASPGYGDAIRELLRFAKIGDNEAQYYVARLLSSNGPHVDKESAYLWFSVSFHGRGYLVNFDNQNGMPPHYCGPVGDFRNESEVAELVMDIGLDRVKELDTQAERWFDMYGSDAAD